MNVAVITMVYNEEIYLPIWCRYYGRALGVENLFVVDHGSDDGSVEKLPRGANLIRIPRGADFDEGPRTTFIVKLQQALHQYYDAVIYCDADEIIVPDPLVYTGLRSYLEQAANVVAPVGLHLFQAVDREEKIDLGRPILGQRRYCQFSAAMCKPVLTKVPVEWSMGFHSATEKPFYAEDIFLFHLKSIDKEQSLVRLERTRSMAWSEANVRDNVSHHHRTDDEFHLNNFFHSPLNALRAESILDFDFSRDVESARSRVVNSQGFFDLRNFNGKVAEVPERFWGIF